jgi:hypothetical protein
LKLIGKSEKVPGATDNTVYTIKNLFGQAEPILNSFARSLTEKLNTAHSVKKPVLISVSVSKDQLADLKLFKFIENQILTSYQQKS